MKTWQKVLIGAGFFALGFLSMEGLKMKIPALRTRGSDGMCAAWTVNGNAHLPEGKAWACYDDDEQQCNAVCIDLVDALPRLCAELNKDTL